MSTNIEARQINAVQPRTRENHMVYQQFPGQQLSFGEVYDSKAGVNGLTGKSHKQGVKQMEHEANFGDGDSRGVQYVNNRDQTRVPVFNNPMLDQS